MSKENILDGDLHFERIGTMPSKLYFGIKSSSLHPLFVLFFKAYENQLEEVSLTWFFFFSIFIIMSSFFIIKSIITNIYMIKNKIKHCSPILNWIEHWQVRPSKFW